MRVDPKDTVDDDVQTVEANVRSIDLGRTIGREPVELASERAPRKSASNQVVTDALIWLRVDSPILSCRSACKLVSDHPDDKSCCECVVVSRVLRGV